MFRGKQSFNIEFGGVKVKNVATKVGRAVGGKKGEEIGKKIDKATEYLTIKIDK